MAVLKLTYCQLIKIILSQIGGSPLQQYYSALIAGLPTITKGGLIPAGLSQIKQLMDQATTAINTAQAAINDFSNITQSVASQIFRNPVGSATTALKSRLETRKAAIESEIGEGSPTTEQAEELAALNDMISKLNDFKKYTDILSGVGDPTASGGLGSCSLQDLLGTGCSPNSEVPDVDLQTIINALTLENVINSLTTSVINATGFNDFKNALANLTSTVNNFNLTFKNVINKTVIKGAIVSAVNQIVFNLLSGCGSGAYELTIKDEWKGAISAYANVMNTLRVGNAYYGENSNNVVTVSSWGD
ncbi:MAG: hypothetical protein EBU90_07375 [Proteobacteria bacterium]|nr:hypothetical protein [Pseudomonadota bacterium]NBP13476.1 hypothetical protein [bacterium]